MPWAAAAGALVSSVANKALSSDKNGGAGTTTASKDPWSEAVPWLKANIAQGQSLQNQYQTTPFNQQQLNAYSNMGKQAQYANAVVPDLLGQISGQQTGFDRSNPSARPAAYNLNGLLGPSSSSTGTAPTSSGLLSLLSPSTMSTTTSAANPAPVAPAPVAAPAFTNQGNGIISNATGNYGTFNYGDQPEAGTPAYRDMMEYFQYGGADPFNKYGRGVGQFDRGANDLG